MRSAQGQSRRAVPWFTDKKQLPSNNTASTPILRRLDLVETRIENMHALTRLRNPACRTLLAGLVVLTAVSTLSAQEFKNLLGEDQGIFGGARQTDPIVTAALEPQSAARGDEVTLSIRVELAPDHYTYSMNPSFGGATRIELEDLAGLEPLDDSFTADHAPKKVFEPVFDQEIEKFFDKVVWSRKYRVVGDPGSVELVGVLKYQVCDASSCRNLKHPFRVTLAAGSDRRETASTVFGAPSHPLSYSQTPERKPGRPEPLTFEFELSPADAKAGQTVTLLVTANLEPEWHTFALDQDPRMAGLPTVITIEETTGLKSLGDTFSASKEAEIERPLDHEGQPLTTLIDEKEQPIVQRVHYGRVTWTLPFEVTESGAEGGYGVAGNIRFQVCRHGTCWPAFTVPFMLGMVVEDRPEAAAGIAAQPGRNAVEPEVFDGGADLGGAGEGDIQSLGLVPFLISAVAAGFLALLTPCVFPMIPITVSFFLKQSEKEHHRPVTMAVVYCVGIVLTFTVLGLLMAAIFGATKPNMIANNPWLNLGIAAMLVFFGMNLLGMFEIRVPSWLLTWSSGKEGQGGFAGVLFMSLTFTLVSFTCTFAFLGGLFALASRGEYYWPVLGTLAFSAAFSLPFFFLALFPSWLQKLPKSGGWMNTVKVTMGMIEVGAAFKFLSVADLAWNPEPVLFDLALVLSAWIVICGCTGLYLLGLFRLPHDTPTESISVVRLAAAMTFLGFGGYLAVGLFAPEKPDAKIWEQIAAFLPGKFEGGVDDIGPFLEHKGLRFALDVDRAFEVAASTDQPLFLDFTGVNCVNCRLMEERMSEPQNRKLLESFLRVQLYTDNVPEVPDRELVDKLLERNRELQEEWFGDVTLPAYAVVAPKGKKILATFKGLETEEGQFAEFLDRGLEKWREVSAADKSKSRLARR